MSLINKDGTRKIFVLSGDHDQDYFLSKDDLGEHWDLLMSCHHQGSCDDDVSEAVKYFHIENETKALNWLIDCGIERDRFLEDEELPIDHDEQVIDSEAVESYYLWILAGDIQERIDE